MLETSKLAVTLSNSNLNISPNISIPNKIKPIKMFQSQQREIT